MPFLHSSFDGANLHYIDYTPAPPTALQATKSDGNGSPVLVFIHGWPMSSLMFEHLMLDFCETQQLRCIGIDRRGFGKSEWSGNSKPRGKQVTYQVFASDTVDIITHLDLEAFIFVAASMGCGETILAYNMLSNQQKPSCKGLVWLGPSLPYNVQTPLNPTAPPRELWEAITQGFRANRAGFTKASLPGVSGVPAGVPLDESILLRFEYIVHQADSLAIERCVGIVTSKDFTEDVKEMGKNERVKVLVIHGDKDQGKHSAVAGNSLARVVTNVVISRRPIRGQCETSCRSDATSKCPPLQECSTRLVRDSCPSSDRRHLDLRGFTRGMEAESQDVEGCTGRRGHGRCRC